MILVTGATGHFGKAAIDFLLKKVPPSEIAVLARNPQKAVDIASQGIDIRKGDYRDYVSLVKAFEGVDKLLFISSSDLTDRVSQHRNIVNASKEAGVKHIVYTSVLNPPEDPYFTPTIDHKETEKLIIDSGIAYTFLRNAFYFETIPMFIGDALQSGKIFFAAGEGRLSDAARVDMAEAAANVLTTSGHENKIYEVGANDSFSFQGIADALSELSGKRIEYVDIPLGVLKEELAKTQIPEMIEMIAGIANAIKLGELNYPSEDLKSLLGREPLGLKDYLKQTYFQETRAVV